MHGRVELIWLDAQIDYDATKPNCSNSSNNHTSHDSVSVVRTTFKVYGKRQTLTLSQPKTPKPIVTKYERRDSVVNAYHQNKFGLNPHMGFCSPYRWNIHPTCSKFTTLFWFLNSPTSESIRPILRLMSYDVVLRKEVIFYCYKITILFFTYLFKKLKKITMAPMGKIFGCRIWFLGTA